MTDPQSTNEGPPMTKTLQAAAQALPDAAFTRWATSPTSCIPAGTPWGVTGQVREVFMAGWNAAISAPQPPGDWQHPIDVQWPAATQPEPTYTHAEVRRMVNELSASAKAYGLEVVSTITGPDTAVLGLRRIEPQPAADERVAEHMKLVRLYGDESYGCTRKVADAYAAVESSARALLAAGREDFSKAVADVLAERKRQVSVEGWTPEHDDEHSDGELARAAACYANPEIWNVFGATRIGWPWAPEWWKPKDNRRNLVRAAALIIAEMERIDRAAIQKGTP